MSKRDDLPPHVPRGQHEFEEWLRRSSEDSQFFAQQWLGHHKDGEAGEPWKGGIRNYGPHKDMMGALDDRDQKLVMILMPRESYKSTGVLAKIVQTIVFEHNCRILYGMHDQAKAKQRVDQVRQTLENNPIIRYLRGDPKGRLWKQHEFITSWRTDGSLLEPTLSCFSRENEPTGGHYTDVYLDDIVDRASCRTDTGLKSGIDCLKFCMPLRAARIGRLIDIGTLYDAGDVHHYIMELPGWKKVIHQVSYEIEQQQDGTFDLVGEEPFFHMLTKDFLREQLQVMGTVEWMSQYKNRLVGGAHQAFARHQFQPMNWSEKLRDLTGYLLTDVATSEQLEGCMNVIAYVGIDEALRLYILDLFIGHFPQGEFVERFFEMRARWTGRVNHQAEGMETTALNNTYKAALLKRARELNVTLNLMTFPRGTGSEGKDQRIARLQPRFHCREVFVVDTVPKTYPDLGKVRMLWDPDGYIDPSTSARYPGGELVEQFVRWPVGKMKDIPDAISCIDEIDKQTGQRMCFYRRPSRLAMTDDIVRPRVGQAGRSGRRPLMQDWHTRMARKLKW